MGAAPAAPATEPAGNEMPFEKEPFNAGVEADEATDPKKFIEQLSGKLGQSLRKFATDQGQPDFKLEKFAINSVLSATHTAEMNPKDQDEIIKRVKTEGGEGEESAEAPVEPAIPAEPEAPANDKGEESTDEQTLVEMSLNDVNSQKLIQLYKAGGKSSQIVYKLVAHRNDFDNSAEFVEALKDHVDYKELRYIFDELKNYGVKMPNDVEEPYHMTEGLESPETLRIFEDKSNSMSQPDVKPTTKPVTKPTTKPTEKPSRRGKPFQPVVTPGVRPDPKAQA